MLYKEVICLWHYNIHTDISSFLANCKESEEILKFSSLEISFLMFLNIPFYKSYQCELAPVNVIWWELLVCLGTQSSTSLVIFLKNFIRWFSTNSNVDTANKSRSPGQAIFFETAIAKVLILILGFLTNKTSEWQLLALYSIGLHTMKC